MPDRHFSELRQLVPDRVRLRQGVHKTIDRVGLRLGGMLTDIFGRNERKMLDRLVQCIAAREILAELTYHVRCNAGLLALAMEVELDAHSIWRLSGLLQDCDATTRTHIRQSPLTQTGPHRDLRMRCGRKANNGTDRQEAVPNGHRRGASPPPHDFIGIRNVLLHQRSRTAPPCRGP